MIKSNFLLISAFIFLNLNFNCFSKKIVYPVEDGQTWGSTKLSYELDDEWEFQVSQELRYSQYSSVLDQSLSDIGMNYQISEMLKLGLFYRFRYYPEEIDRRHEIFSNFTIKQKFDDIKISNRTRLHIKFRENKESINNLRNETSIAYRLFGILSPYISAEFFYRFLYNEGDRLTQGRYAVGLDIELTDTIELNVFFMREEEYNNNKAINSNIIGFDLSFTIK